MTPDPRALVTPGGICIETDEDGKQKGVIIITSNESERVLLYKLKTNAPSKYVVRQSLGVLMPGQKREITVRPKTDDSSDDKFQLEIRTAAAGEEGTLRGYAGSRDMTKYEDAERDLVSKMWKEAGGEVAKNQYLLLLQSKGSVKAEALPKKTAKDANKEWTSQQEGAKPEGSVEKLTEKKEDLERVRSEASNQVKTLEEANKVAEKRVAPRKSFPLTVPLWLSLLLIFTAFGLGMFLSTAAADMDLTPSPFLTEYLSHFNRPLVMEE